MTALLSTYPANEDIGIPIGTELFLKFDTAIDLIGATNYIVLYGKDYDVRTGPGASIWIDKQGVNPYAFKSPGLKGIVPIKLSGFYLNPDDSAADLESRVDPDVNPLNYKVVITPESSLLPDVEYVLQVIGDPASASVGINSRSVWDPATVANTGDGDIVSKGSYDTNGDDELNIKITTAGNIGAAKYKWWWTSLGEVSAKTKRLTHSKYFVIDRGVEIAFTGSSFAVDDSWTVFCLAGTRLETNYKIAFTTNDGTYSTAPTSPSTPTTSVPPSNAIPPLPGEYSDDFLYPVAMTPEDSSYNNDNETHVIVIEFNYDLDPDTVTDETVMLQMLPINGIYNQNGRLLELAKTLEVVGSKIIITI